MFSYRGERRSGSETTSENTLKTLDPCKFSRNQKAHYYRRLRPTRPELARQLFLRERQAERGIGARKK